MKVDKEIVVVGNVIREETSNNKQQRQNARPSSGLRMAEKTTKVKERHHLE